MNVLVTLGTTPFNELLRAIDEQQIDQKTILTVQAIGESSFNFNNSFEFSSDIQHWYDWADVVITHAGAGSIYRLLEQDKKIIVVPNTFRKDKHQLDIAKYVEENCYGSVCYELSEITNCLEKAAEFSVKPYNKTEFSGASDISEALFG
ncbi:PssE/Cps14G family polysaccharide biosynthesis glycosyltransferase [Thalassotalea euphylliae]|uniref:Glycosyl transferase family 28 C-terminal domain-containing protein n=1 Tax=Thalassotalea euphylliae TaxID=1655234 RepID=A0A3E0TZX2_9GAMM|nr:PssE/Cps14G family polysaccharide biosynthesis glycosyltransferase [Thalassotalea euphylliae]REL30208.1 hypothetical protein DXX94_05530 [Thalassotalea euphylliae]